MTAKEQLKQIKRLDTHINHKMKELEQYKNSILAVKGLDYSADKIQVSQKSDAPFVNALVKLTEMSQKIDSQIDEFVDLKHKIIEKIHKLDDIRYAEILFARYVEYKSFEQIAVDMAYSYEYVLKLHGNALIAFQKKMT